VNPPRLRAAPMARRRGRPGSFNAGKGAWLCGY
jgi:hypothetical protein